MTRRGLAWMLLLQLAVLLALSFAAFARSAQDLVPACCRGNGSHRCAMSQGPVISNGSGVAFRAAPCSMWPSRQSVAVRRTDAVPVVAGSRRRQLKLEAAVAHGVLRAYSHAVFVRSPRGPPRVSA